MQLQSCVWTRYELSAALQVKVLQEDVGGTGQEQAGTGNPRAILLSKSGGGDCHPPWVIAANQDFAFPKTQGERPPDYKEGVRYFAAVDALTADDIEVQRLLIEVFNLAKPPVRVK